jgi:hypothetical protein
MAAAAIEVPVTQIQKFEVQVTQISKFEVSVTQLSKFEVPVTQKSKSVFDGKRRWSLIETY